jgi:UDP-N-acetylmuramoyl-L-alanyl-D-glutamate--2,6-diaminopimelate ligase
MAAALRLTDIMRATHASGNAANPVEITGLTADSRAVLPGYLFAALPGGKVSGVDFIADAERLGAAAVLAPIGTAKPGIPLIESAQPRRLFAQMAAAFYGRQPETVVAVTGTSGKSSTVAFARQIWANLGKSSSSIGTIGIDSDPIQRYGALTTADPVQLHADLAALADAGVTCADGSVFRGQAASVHRGSGAGRRRGSECRYSRIRPAGRSSGSRGPSHHLLRRPWA